MKYLLYNVIKDTEGEVYGSPEDVPKIDAFLKDNSIQHKFIKGEFYDYWVLVIQDSEIVLLTLKFLNLEFFRVNDFNERVL